MRDERYLRNRKVGCLKQLLGHTYNLGRKNWKLITSPYNTFWGILVLVGTNMILVNGHTFSNWYNRNDKDLTTWKQVKGVSNEHETTDNTSWINMTVTSKMRLQVTHLWQAWLWYSSPLNWLTSLSTNS